MSHIFLLIKSLNPFVKFCLWFLIIVINVSVAICQLPICQFCSFGKRYIDCQLPFGECLLDQFSESFYFYTEESQTPQASSANRI